jgi:hypothetical protein
MIVIQHGEARRQGRMSTKVVYVFTLLGLLPRIRFSMAYCLFFCKKNFHLDVLQKRQIHEILLNLRT